ncbi:MAG: sterol desaturase [Rhodospirillales bacterium 20-60-12]|nr:MAG: sterol desaturase [Rhodospirillales bacterium 20-60-12]
MASDAVARFDVHIFALEALRLTVWLVLLSAIFVPLERLAGVRRQQIFRRQFGVDLFYYMINSMLIGLLLAAPLSVVATVIYNIMPAFLVQGVSGLPAGAKLALSLLVAETGFYWGHRWSHEIPLLWRFHAVHHSAEELDYLTNTRAHPVDMVFTRLCGFLPLFALGLAHGPAVPAIVIVIGTMWGFFVHANIKFRFGFLESLIATPFFHRWHHTNDAMRDRNYAAMLPLLDRLFGTFHAPQSWPSEYGIDQPMPAHIRGQLLSPFTPAAPAPTPVLD